MLFERTKIELRRFLIIDHAGREHFTEETTYFKEAFPAKSWPVRFLRLIASHVGPPQWLQTSRNVELANGKGVLMANSDGTFSHASTGEIYRRKACDNEVGAFDDYRVPFTY